MSDTRAFVDRYLRQTAEIAAATSREDLTRTIELLFGAWKAERTVFTCGNGGSAANASHLACDLAKFTHVPGRPRLR